MNTPPIVQKTGKSLATRLVLLIAVPLLLQCLFIVYISQKLSEAEAEAARASKANKLSRSVNKLIRDMADIASITKVGEEAPVEAIKPISLAVHNIINEFKDLEEITRDDEEKHKIVISARDSLIEAGAVFKELLKSTLYGGVEKDQRKLLWHHLRTAIQGAMSRDLVTLNANEERISKESDRNQSEIRQATRTILIASAITLGTALVLGIFLGRNIISRLSLLTDNAFRLAAGQSLNPKIRGSDDEIAILDQSIHEMAERLAEASRKERAATENALDMICSLDKNLRILSANPAAALFLKAPLEDIVGRRLMDFVAPLDWPNALVVFESLNAGGQSVVESLEMQLMARGGQVIDSDWSMRYSALENSIFCVAHNISERKRAEELRQELVSMITHDLRTPLSAASNAMEMLASGRLGSLSEKGSSFVELASRNTAQMAHLIDDLLDLEKARSGMMQLNMETVSLEKVFKNTCELVQPIATKKDIALDRQASEICVTADPERLTRILLNLISNALKYSKGGTSIHIAAKRNGEQAEISVRDQGSGIPAEKLPHLFDKYYQTDKEHAQIGSGLGLSICKVLVELHGGKITVNSQVGHGTEFVFSLPLA